MNGASFDNFMIKVIEIKGKCPHYQKKFSELTEMGITKNNISKEEFKEYTRFDEKLLREIYQGHIPPKQTVLTISIMLGLDLIETMLFLMSAGYILNPITNSIDRKYMIYIDEVRDEKEEIDYRVYSCNDYLRENNKSCSPDIIGCEECKKNKKCKYKKFILGNWKRKKKEETKKEKQKSTSLSYKKDKEILKDRV